MKRAAPWVVGGLLLALVFLFLHRAARVGQVSSLAATVLSGGDPGWRTRATEGKRPVVVLGIGLINSSAAPIELETLPGEYRMRLELSPHLELPVRYPLRDVVLSQELDVTVPHEGKVVVKLRLPD